MRRSAGATYDEAEAVSLPGVPPPRITDPAPTAEQLDRRARSVARLTREGVPVLESLPVIETEAETHFRTRDEIVDRAVALLVVASRGAGDPPEHVADLEQRFQAVSRYSPDERAFMLGLTPDQAVAMSWRFEALLVLAWAIGLVDALPSPASPTDGRVVLAAFEGHTLESLRARATVRTGAELLDAADLFYRYDWAVVDARVRGVPPPAAVSPDVIMEWHHAINWLIGYQGAAWDDVPTDT